VRKLKIFAAGWAVHTLQEKRPLHDFATFIPRMLHNQLIDLSSPMGASLRFLGEGRTLQAAALFSDASGFTALTEKLAQQANGAEKMCKIMNAFLTQMISIIDAFGGDVIKFAGDALLVVFPLDEAGLGRPGTFASMREATIKAAACACRLNQSMHQYKAFEDEMLTYTLSLHIGVGCGTLTALHLGGVFNRWEFVLSGPPIAQVATAEPLAVSGETCCSPEAWEHVSSVATGHAASADAEAKGFVIIDEIEPSVMHGVPPPPALPVTRAVAQLMKRYVPDSIAPKIEAGFIPKEGQMAEIREVSVLFINCLGLDLVASEGYDCAAATRAGVSLMQEVQKQVARHEGAVNKMLVDDKGTLLICALGLPPRPHSDDAFRAVSLALDIENRLQALRSDGSITSSVDASRSKPYTDASTSRSCASVSAMNAASRITGGPNSGLAPSNSHTQMGTASRVLGIDSSEATAVHQNLAHANSGLAASSIDEVSASEKAATPATTAAATATADATAASTTATTATTDATNATTVVPKPSAATAAVHPLLNSVSSVMSTVASNASNASNAASVVASPKLSQDNSYVLEGESAAHSHARDATDFSCTIGVASGHAFCGVVGSTTRREYTMMGDVVNLSARLMGHATKHNLRILTDSTTYKLTSGIVEYKVLEPQKLKGKQNKVPMYEPLRIVRQQKQTVSVMNEGRTTELSQLRTTMAMLHTFRAGGTILMLGERGSGKNYMVHKLKSDAENAGMRVVQGTSEVGGNTQVGDESRIDADDQSSLYKPWYSVMETIVSRLVELDVKRSSGKRKEEKVILDCLHRQLVLNSRLHQAAFAPELNHVIGRDLIKKPENYRPPHPTKRSQLRAELACALILELAEFEHFLVILYLHTGTSSTLPGFDNSAVAKTVDYSWKIANMLAKETHNRKPPQKTLLLCVVSRSAMFLHPKQEIEEVVALAKKKLPPLIDERIIKLEPLDRERRRQYLTDLLRVKYRIEGDEDVPEHLFTYVSDVAAGIPKHIDEVVKALKDAGELEVISSDAAAGGYRVLRVGQRKSLYEVEPPKKMVGSARQSFEALDQRHQIIVKYLSPMPAFTAGMLRGLIPESIATSSTELSVDLQDLVGHRVLDECPVIPESVQIHDATAKIAYEFSNKLMQQEVMKMLLEEQRQAVHDHLELLRNNVAMMREREASTSTDLYLREHSPTRARNASERRMSWVALLSAFNEKRGEKSARFLSEKSRRSSEPDKGSTNNLLRGPTSSNEPTVDETQKSPSPLFSWMPNIGKIPSRVTGRRSSDPGRSANSAEAGGVQTVTGEAVGAEAATAKAKPYRKKSLLISQWSANLAATVSRAVTFGNHSFKRERHSSPTTQTAAASAPAAGSLRSERT